MAAMEKQKQGLASNQESIKEKMISIIIPVYKVEAYLDQCVQSVVDQTYRDLEIILVDDGSPDRCGAMCDAWAKKDSRIRVIHKENGGAGRARNSALDIAKGEFIAFVDSDDYMSAQMLEHLLSCFEVSPEIDIAECEYISVADNCADYSVFCEKEGLKVYEPSEAMESHIAGKEFKQVIWNKLYKKDVVWSIRFPEGKMIDDEFWTYQVIGKAKALAHSDSVMYAYRQQAGSVMHEVYSKKRLHALEAKAQRYEYISEKYPELVSQAHIDYWLTCMYHGQMAMRYVEKEECKEIVDTVQVYLKKAPLIYRQMGQLDLDYKVWACLSCISFKATCRLRNLLKIGM